jgi:hypothetical protein
MGPVTLSQVMEAFANLGGEANWRDAFDELHQIRGQDYSHYLNWMNYETTAFQLVQEHTRGYRKYRGPAKFDKLGRRRFRLLNQSSVSVPPLAPEPQRTPIAADLEEPSVSEWAIQEVYRVLRDTAVARRVKEAAGYRCQVCGETLTLANGSLYAEAHHVRPLGSPHNGPDDEDNIVCVCPNHHALLDYNSLGLTPEDFPQVRAEYLEYHNSLVREAQA